MPDIALLQGAITSLNAAREIIKGLIGLKVSAEVTSKAIELQEIVLAAQDRAFSAHAEQLTMLQTIGQYKEQIAQMSEWKEEKQRYALKPFASGQFVYALKKERANGEPAHWICTKCYSNSTVGLLQRIGPVQISLQEYLCPVCKTKIPARSGPAKMQYAEDMSN